MWKLLCLVCLCHGPLLLAEDPRLQIDEVNECVAKAKLFMRSDQYSGQAKEQALIGACRDADPLCVQEVGESLHASDDNDKRDFLTLVKACRGKGMGKCFRAVKDTVASFDRRETAQILALLKKCN